MVTFMVTTTDTDMVTVMATAMVTVTTIIIAKVLRKKNEKSVRRPTKSTKRLTRKSTSSINIVTKQRAETTGRQLEQNGKKKIPNPLLKSMITKSKFYFLFHVIKILTSKITLITKFVFTVMKI